MAWNTSYTRFKSTQLAGLDCGNYLKIPQGQGIIKDLGVYDGDIEVGQCVAMVRVPAGAIMVSAELSWDGTAVSNLGVGDPYACGRLITAANTGRPRGKDNTFAVTQLLDCTSWLAWGSCGTMTKTGRVGDGCGIGYTYTCETDIVVTNLYSSGNGLAGGWAGGTWANSTTTPSAKWTGGRITLTVEYLAP